MAGLEEPTVFDLIFKKDFFLAVKKNSWKKSIFQGRGSRLAVKQCCPSLRGGIHNWCGGSIQVFMLGKGLLKCIPIPFFSVQNEKEKNAGRVRITVWNSYLSAKINQKDKNLFVVTDRGDWVKIKFIFVWKTHNNLTEFLNLYLTLQYR